MNLKTINQILDAISEIKMDSMTLKLGEVRQTLIDYKKDTSKGGLYLVENTAEIMELINDEEYEPYFGWCNVEGCENEGANGGNCWPETGYWTVCSKHAAEYRAGQPQPKMQQKYIDKEATRLPDGTLPVVNESKNKQSNFGRNQRSSF